MATNPYFDAKGNIIGTYKQREVRGMATEIRIEDGEGWICEYVNDKEDCGLPAKRWMLECGDTLFFACAKHGKTIKKMVEFAETNTIAFRGGYDEPKSKLAQAVSCVESLEFSGNELVLAQCIELIGKHLIEKEKTDG